MRTHFATGLFAASLLISPYMVGQQHRLACPDRKSTSACASFRELLESDDKDFSVWRAEVDNALACFRPGEDSFFVALWQNPIWLEGIKQNGTPKQRGLVSLHYYRDGVWDHSLELWGNWEGVQDFGGEVNVFESRSEMPDFIHVSATNLEAAQGSSGYGLNLQLANLRFVEHWSGGETDRSVSGRCVRFGRAK